MELLSAPLHTGSVPWQRLLLAVSLITYWSSPTTAQVHIDPVPPHVAEGKSVLLRVSNLPENLLIIRWYKGKLPLPEYELARYIITSNENKTGPAYSGRETIFPNGSLLFQNVNQNDTGFYTFQITTSVGDTEQLSLKFDVYPTPDSGLPAGATAGIVVGVVAGVALIAALVYFLYSRKTGRTSVQHDLRQPKPPVSTAGPGTSDRYTHDPISTPKEATAVYQELLHPSRNIYGQINHSRDVSS